MRAISSKAILVKSKDDEATKKKTETEAGADKTQDKSNTKSERLAEIFNELGFDLEEKRLKFQKRKIIIAILTFILFALLVILVTLLQLDTIVLFVYNDQEALVANAELCQVIDYSNFNIISQPLATLLGLIYMFVFWRRSCCLGCLIRRPAAPMVIHPFKKKDRFMSACVYGIIAHEVMTIVFSAITKTSVADNLNTLVNDPSGLFKLTIRICEVFMCAVRYYPPLVAFCANSTFIYITSAIYLLIDIGNNIYVEGNLIFFLKMLH
jgi:hypothetical protein